MQVWETLTAGSSAKQKPIWLYTGSLQPRPTPELKGQSPSAPNPVFTANKGWELGTGDGHVTHSTSHLVGEPRKPKATFYKHNFQLKIGIHLGKPAHS